jgi:hypothetical protein
MYSLDLNILAIPAKNLKVRKLKNGDKAAFCNLILAERKEADQYGNTHTVFISQSKEEREAQTPKIYIGSAKLIGAETATENPFEKLELTEETAENDDLQF